MPYLIEITEKTHTGWYTVNFIIISSTNIRIHTLETKGPVGIVQASDQLIHRIAISH
jgi:hypothetical protein